jgi:hypothetical protein
MMKKIELVRGIQEYLTLADYKPVGVGASTVSLVRQNPDWKEEIIISYRKYPGFFCLSPAVTGMKSFQEIEGILERYFKEAGINRSLVTIYKSSRRDEKIADIKIAEPTDIEKVLPSLRQMVYKDILPFFDEYRTLQDVYRRVSEFDNDFARINQFLFAPQPIRRIVLNRLCGDPDWQAYGKLVYEGFKKAASGPQGKMYEDYIKFLPSLLEELETIDPKNFK